MSVIRTSRVAWALKGSKPYTFSVEVSYAHIFLGRDPIDLFRVNQIFKEISDNQKVKHHCMAIVTMETTEDKGYAIFHSQIMKGNSNYPTF